MKYHQCEWWCEKPAIRRFSATLAANGVSTDYIRYSCGNIYHDERVRRLMLNDGVIDWVERVSSEPFKIEKTPANDLG